jgi:hypothetical protein
MKLKVIRFAVIGVVLTSLVASVSKCSGNDERSLYDLIDKLQRKYFPNTELNEYIIKDDKLLRQRIERNVDESIRQVTPEYERIIREADKKFQPRYSEKPVDSSVCYTDECRSLGGEMRICSPWALDCPPGNVVQ